MSLRTDKTAFLILLAAVVLIGAVSTSIWIGAAGMGVSPVSLMSAEAVAALGICLVLTSLNLALRWLRWHFLIRRFTRRIATRDSLIVYLATLPAIVTPFFAGELVRVMILRRRPGTQASHLSWVWLIERVLDAAVLLVFLILATNFDAGVILVPVVALGSYLLFHWLLADQPAARVARVSAAALGATAIAWTLPIAALLATLVRLSEPIGVATGMSAFSTGTLLGGASGLPLGVSVTGSTMIRELMGAGVSARVAVQGILVYRLGTALYAVVLGVVSFLVWRGRLANIMSTGAGHFDDIAHAYEEQIPTHVRDRLLAKKTILIRRQLESAGITAGARGLDLGCGHGWYLAEFTREGYRVGGLDYSTGQLHRASSHLAEGGLPRPLLQADAVALPFADNVFDFVYSINAFHHFASAGAQSRAVGEVVRVLRPGGTFILHEINTQNLLFRTYMGYVFPLLKQIDEGTEHWLLPSALPSVDGARWLPDIVYFTFMPDFVPRLAQKALERMEQVLERSSWRWLSAHYQVSLVKDPPAEDSALRAS